MNIDPEDRGLVRELPQLVFVDVEERRRGILEDYGLTGYTC